MIATAVMMLDGLALMGLAEYTLTGAGDPIRIEGARVTPSVRNSGSRLC